MVDEPIDRGNHRDSDGRARLYEEHHRLKISDEALKAAANLAARYVTDRFMPDKAIDLIDEAASRVRMQRSAAPPSLQGCPCAVLHSLQRELEAAVESQQFEIAAELRDRERKLRDRIDDQEQELAAISRPRKSPTLPKKTSPQVVSMWTGIPVMPHRRRGIRAAAQDGRSAA